MSDLLVVELSISVVLGLLSVMLFGSVLYIRALVKGSLVGTAQMEIAKANFQTMSKALHELQVNDTLKDLTPFVQIVCERFDADYCSLMRNTGTGRTEVVCQYDPENTTFLPSLREGLMEEAFRKLSTHFELYDHLELNEEKSANLWRLHGFSDEQIAQSAIKFTQIVPVKVRGQFWGAIQIGHRVTRHFTEDEWSHLHRLAEILAIAVRRRDRNEELQVALDRAAAADKAKFFFSTVSHDIRTPLNAIIGFSQMLKIGFATEKERDDAIDSIIVSGKTLLQLINDLLDLSKLESGKMVISNEPCDFPKLANEIADSFRASNIETPIDIRANISDMPILMIDPQRTRQIIFNLMGNAIKFTERGHVEIRARFTPNTDDPSVGTLKYEVEDTGCGISEENQKLLATPYVQFAKGVKKGGTGLGLTICRQLVAAMNGEVELFSELGRGSTFGVTIPNVAVSKHTIGGKPSATRKIEVDLGNPNDVKYHHVLVVDDSKVNLMVLSSMLKRFGVKDIVTATDGLKALEALGTRKPDGFDLVLSDMWMPEMDGEGLIKAIRADSRYADIAAYAVTADVEVRDSALNVGFDGVLLKPVTFETIKTILM